jgi:hypothetical protein
VYTRCLLSTVLEGVTYQILKELYKMWLVSLYSGEVIACDTRATFINRGSIILKYLAKKILAASRVKRS